MRDFGWDIVDVGGIESSRYLEAMCMVWVLSAMRTNNRNQAFKMLRKYDVLRRHRAIVWPLGCAY